MTWWSVKTAADIRIAPVGGEELFALTQDEPAIDVLLHQRIDQGPAGCSREIGTGRSEPHLLDCKTERRHIHCPDPHQPDAADDRGQDGQTTEGADTHPSLRGGDQLRRPCSTIRYQAAGKSTSQIFAARKTACPSGPGAATIAAMTPRLGTGTISRRARTAFLREGTSASRSHGR